MKLPAGLPATGSLPAGSGVPDGGAGGAKSTGTTGTGTTGAAVTGMVPGGVTAAGPLDDCNAAPPPPPPQAVKAAVNTAMTLKSWIEFFKSFPFMHGQVDRRPKLEMNE